MIDCLVILLKECLVKFAMMSVPRSRTLAVVASWAPITISEKYEWERKRQKYQQSSQTVTTQTSII